MIFLKNFFIRFIRCRDLQTRSFHEHHGESTVITLHGSAKTVSLPCPAVHGRFHIAAGSDFVECHILPFRKRFFKLLILFVPGSLNGRVPPGYLVDVVNGFWIVGDFGGDLDLVIRVQTVPWGDEELPVGDRGVLRRLCVEEGGQMLGEVRAEWIRMVIIPIGYPGFRFVKGFRNSLP